MGKRGPKPSGVEKRVFYRRVEPWMFDALDKVWPNLIASCSNAEEVQSALKCHPWNKVGSEKVVKGPDHQVGLLLEDVEAKAIEIEILKNKLEEVMMQDLDEKGRLGWKLYYELKNQGKKNEFDQT